MTNKEIKQIYELIDETKKALDDIKICKYMIEIYNADIKENDLIIDKNKIIIDKIITIMKEDQNGN